MKRLVVCCDGTWNSLDQLRGGTASPTNVAKLAYRIEKSAPGGVPQIVFYDEGIGLGNLSDRVLGAAFGAGLDEHIFRAYRFLVANYELGDEIFLFGFSRGAYTARSLAGMIRKCGVLNREQLEDYRKAVALYRNGDHPDDARPREFRDRASIGGDRPIAIKMIGVWDTVGALGIPLTQLKWITAPHYAFHDVELSGSVERAYHALAIDEHRDPFTPTLWPPIPKAQTIEQVWFAGTHSNVGGGCPDHGLSDIALGWMIEKATGAGLAFDQTLLRGAHTLAPNPRAPTYRLETMFNGWFLRRDRVIGQAVDKHGVRTANADPTQSLHPTVLVRWNEVPAWRPQSLIRYFEERQSDRIE